MLEGLNLSAITKMKHMAWETPIAIEMTRGGLRSLSPLARILTLTRSGCTSELLTDNLLHFPTCISHLCLATQKGKFRQVTHRVADRQCDIELE